MFRRRDLVSLFCELVYVLNPGTCLPCDGNCFQTAEKGSMSCPSIQSLPPRALGFFRPWMVLTSSGVQPPYGLLSFVDDARGFIL